MAWFWFYLGFSCGFLVCLFLASRRRRGGYQPRARAPGPIVFPPTPRARSTRIPGRSWRRPSDG